MHWPAGATPRSSAGVCLVGPHRDDLELRLGDQIAKGFASHGESWSMALALRLAAYELLRAEGGDPVLLLDDVFAELDTARRRALAEVAASAEQVLVTAAVGEDIPATGTRAESRSPCATRTAAGSRWWNREPEDDASEDRSEDGEDRSERESRQ